MMLRLLSFVCLFLAPTTTRANVVGVDAQSFNATTNGLDFVTVQSSDILEKGVVNLGAFFNYAVNSLPYLGDDDNVKWSLKPRDEIATADFNAGYGLFKHLDLGISFPNIIYQRVENKNTQRGEFVQTGITEVRFNTKLRFFGDHRGGVAFVATVNYNLLQDNPYLGQNASFVYAGELVAHKVLGPVTGGVNFGYRGRQKGEKIPGAPIEPLSDQYLASGAMNYHLRTLRTKVIGEVFSAFPTKGSETGSKRASSSVEGILGTKTDVTDSLALHFGAGSELRHGLASPDYRIYAGVNYAFGGKQEPQAVAVRQKPIAKNQPEPVQRVQSDEDKPFEGVPVKGEEKIIIRNINFAFDRFDKVVPGGKVILKELAEYLQKPPALQKLIIEGHTDGLGGEEYNLKLSENRAAQIKKYLVAVHGIDASKIETRGFGLSRPVASNGNYQGRRLNRRVEFIILR